MKLFKVSALILFVAALLYSAMTYAANRKTERQKYRLIKSLNGIEIRFYPRAIMASVSSKGSTYMSNSNGHFRKLAGYIFGGNKSSEKIAMTAPVHMEKDSLGNRMSFIMPSQYDLAKLPAPNDSFVDIHYSKEGFFAVLKFGGFANEHKIERKISELKGLLSSLGLKTISEYSYLGYNAPWDIVGRENEIIVQIEYTE